MRQSQEVLATAPSQQHICQSQCVARRERCLENRVEPRQSLGGGVEHLRESQRIEVNQLAIPLPVRLTPALRPGL